MDTSSVYLPIGRLYPRFRWPCAVAVAIAVCGTRLSAQSTACSQITAADVAPIVGAAPMKASQSGCSWRADADRYVSIVENTPKSKAMPVEAMFGAARNAASRTGTVTDETALGDKAFLAISSSGVAALQMMKAGRLLQVQLWVGTAPSPANLALIRAIAAKAVAKF